MNQEFDFRIDKQETSPRQSGRTAAATSSAIDDTPPARTREDKEEGQSRWGKTVPVVLYIYEIIYILLLVF